MALPADSSLITAVASPRPVKLMTQRRRRVVPPNQTDTTQEHALSQFRNNNYDGDGDRGGMVAMAMAMVVTVIAPMVMALVMMAGLIPTIS